MNNLTIIYITTSNVKASLGSEDKRDPLITSCFIICDNYLCWVPKRFASYKYWSILGGIKEKFVIFVLFCFAAQFHNTNKWISYVVHCDVYCNGVLWSKRLPRGWNKNLMFNNFLNWKGETLTHNEPKVFSIEKKWVRKNHF